VTDDPSQNAELRLAHEALARRVVEERLAFADRVQEVLDQAHHLQAELDERTEQLRELRELTDSDATALRARVEALHGELVEAHDAHRGVVESRSYRYTRPFRGLGKALGRR
jgi:uncharacterized coiled-coil DUF342 family protein